MKYEVGYVFTRLFLQKRLDVNEKITVRPIKNTACKGIISDIDEKLKEVNHPLSPEDLEQFYANFCQAGHTVVLTVKDVQAADYVAAIEMHELEAEKIVNSLSILSINPPQRLVAYANTDANQNGVKFYIPNDPIIRHATNVPGYLDAIPDLIVKSLQDAKLALLINLFKTALEQTQWVNKALFLLILFEEASDNETGTLQQRITAHAGRYGYSADLEVIANEIGITIPQGRTVVDMIVKLRNSAAHNGSISVDTLSEYNGEWIIPILENSDTFIRLLTECARYMLITLVGHTREKMAIKVTGPIEFKFD